MKRLILGWAISVLISTSPSGANTLDSAFSEVFLDPSGFETGLDMEFLLLEDYSRATALQNCTTIAVPALKAAVQRLRVQYSGCTPNSVCTELAQQIQSYDALILNVRDLGAFVSASADAAAAGRETARFLDTPLGQRILALHRTSESIGVPVERNPVLRDWLNLLSGMPCP